MAEFDASEKRTHDYTRHGTTNLCAALDVATGEVFGERKPNHDGEDFVALGEAKMRLRAHQQEKLLQTKRR